MEPKASSLTFSVLLKLSMALSTTYSPHTLSHATSQSSESLILFGPSNAGDLWLLSLFFAADANHGSLSCPFLLLLLFY